jgi:hypothetical protein
MLQQQNIQERFNQTVEKLKEIFINVANTLMPIFDVFAGIFEIVGPIVGLIGQLVSFMSPILKPLLAIYGVFKGIQIVNTGLVALNDILLTQQKAMATTEGVRLGLGQRILATLGLQDASLALAEEGDYVAFREAMEETILGTLIIQGLTLVGNVAKSILLTIQAGARFVAESATLGVMSAQNTGFIGLIAKSAIYLAQQIATAVAMISGASVVTLGAAAAIALAAGATAYAFLKGNDILSPGDGSSGYGKRTLFGPEGAISLNNKDTVIAGTDLFQKGNDVAMAPAGAMSVSNRTATKREVTRDPNSGVISAIRDLMQVTGKVNEVSTLKIQ